MGNFVTLFKKDLLEIKRSKSWLIFPLVFILVAGISVVTAKVLPELLNMLLKDTPLNGLMEYIPSIGDSYSQFAANMGEISILLVMILFSTALIKEKKSGTYYMLKDNGVSEAKIVLSHFLSKLILLTLSYLVSVVVFVVSNMIVFNSYTGIRGVVSLSYVYLALIFALAFSLFISSCSKKSVVAYVLSISIYFVLYTISAFPYIDIYNPLYSLVLASNIITKAEYQISDYIINLSVTLSLVVFFIIASIYFFKNKIDNRK